MVAKCILNRRLDIYTNAWSKHAQDQEKEKPEQEESTSVGDALLNFSIRVNSLKQATMIVNRVNFFIKHLKVELVQLNLLETRAGNDQRQNTNRGRFQTNQNTVRPRYQSFNNVQQGMSNFQQPYQGFQNPQQQMTQNLQQGIQQFSSLLNRGTSRGRFRCPCSLVHLCVNILSLGDHCLDARISKLWLLR